MRVIEKIIIWLQEKDRMILLVLVSAILILGAALIITVVKTKQKEQTPEIDLIEELMADQKEEGSEEQFEPSSNIQTHQRPVVESLQEVVVDIKGEIDSPGVYQLKEGSRIIDVIEKAGGLLAEADTASVNFAQLVTDQMVIYIPKEGEESPFNQANMNEIQESSSQVEKQIDLNKAEKDSLMSLNGIGSSKADSIIAYREEYGFFQSIEEIKNVSGIGDATFEKLKDAITVTQ